MKTRRHFLLGILSWAFLANGWAETVKDREGAVRKDRATLETDDRWIYNDLDRGWAEARRTGKPLLVVLRCIPCLACAGLDAQVLMADAELQPMLQEFVCVRLINANALDLGLFQFDYDLSFSTLIFNGDGTLYGRFGSWLHQKDAKEDSTEGYLAALKQSLEIHRGYPGNKERLRGKQGRPTPFRSPLEIPALAGRYQRELDWGGKVVQSCVHCHQIGDAYRAWYRDQRQPIPVEWLYPMPAPEVVGLTLSPRHPAVVEKVMPGSWAEVAGLQPGDEILTMAGQPLISTADFTWVLHTTAEEGGDHEVSIRREGRMVETRLVLPSGWRERAGNAGRVGTWPMRGMALGGMVLEEIPDEERKRLGLGRGQMALRVKGVGMYGKHALARKTGFQQGDVLVAVDGLDQHMTESALLGYLLRKRFPGDKVPFRVRRGPEVLELSLPMQ